MGSIFGNFLPPHALVARFSVFLCAGDGIGLEPGHLRVQLRRCLARRASPRQGNRDDSSVNTLLLCLMLNIHSASPLLSLAWPLGRALSSLAISFTILGTSRLK